MRGFLFSPALTVGGGTSEVLRNIIAERLLGLPHDHDVEQGSRSQRATAVGRADPDARVADGPGVTCCDPAGCVCIFAGAWPPGASTPKGDNRARTECRVSFDHSACGGRGLALLLLVAACSGGDDDDECVRRPQDAERIGPDDHAGAATMAR